MREKPRQVRIPKLGVHKARGLARVVIDGKSIYLGKPGPDAERRYRQVIARWLAGESVAETARERDGVALVADLVAAFLDAHEHYYVGPDGAQTGELGNYKHVLAVLLERAGTLPVGEFRPRRLKALREKMIERGWARSFVNEQTRRVKRLFKWGVQEEIVPPAVYEGWRQTTDAFIRCLENAFRRFGGVPKTLVIDNLKAAVKRADWFDPELCPKFAAFAKHYEIAVLPTKPYTPRHKGKVEGGIKYAQDNALIRHERCPAIAVRVRVRTLARRTSSGESCVESVQTWMQKLTSHEEASSAGGAIVGSPRPGACGRGPAGGSHGPWHRAGTASVRGGGLETLGEGRAHHVREGDRGPGRARQVERSR